MMKMTPYEQMLEAARAAQETKEQRDTSAREFANRLVQGFVAYCKLPAECLRLIPFDEEKQVFEGKADELIGMYQALKLDEESDEWRLGLGIMLRPISPLVTSIVSFGLFITETGSQYSVRTGRGKPLFVDLNVHPQRDALFSTMIAEVIKALEEPKKLESRPLGFHVVQTTAKAPDVLDTTDQPYGIA